MGWIYQTVADAVDSVRQLRSDETAALPAEATEAEAEEEEDDEEGESSPEDAGEDHSGEMGSSNLRFSKVKESCIEHMSLYYYTEAWKKSDSKSLVGQ